MILSEIPSFRLDEYDKDEWFDVAKAMKPGLSPEHYEQMWERWMVARAQHERCNDN